MKIYDKQEIDNSFSKAIDAMRIEGIEARDLGVFFGSLAISIKFRINLLQSGSAKSVDKGNELARLQLASDCLTAKINTGTVSEMSQQIMAAYKAYGTYN